MESELHNPAGEHPEPKKKPAKRRKRRAAPRAKAAPKAAAAPADKPNELDGISQSDCPFDCDPEKCAITDMNVCGHPYKGGLQSALLGKPDVVRRYQAARRIIAHQVTDKKG